jgi:hypothetical protein
MANANQIEAMGKTLRETRCVCGRTKRLRRAFCPSCTIALGDDAMRAARYHLNEKNPVDGKMADAYLECGAWLFVQGYLAKAVTL